MLELGAKPDLPEKPVGCDADQELRMQDLEGDLAILAVAREVDPGIAAFPDLALDPVLTLEGLLDQRQHVPRYG